MELKRVHFLYVLFCFVPFAAQHYLEGARLRKTVVQIMPPNLNSKIYFYSGMYSEESHYENELITKSTNYHKIVAAKASVS